jgi:hypothetical protein
MISKVERGVLGLDSLKLARRIARVLDIELVDLLGFATRPQKGVTSGDPCFDLLNGCDRLGPDSAVEEGGGVKRRETLKAGAADAWSSRQPSTCWAPTMATGCSPPSTTPPAT